jgi:hypothetical protein
MRWQTWQIVRHNPYLKTPPASPEKLMRFPDEIEADQERVTKAAERLKQAMKNNGRR